MKASEAPEKIYLSFETDEDGYIYPDYMWHRQQFEGVKNIEYTRTDAFIEKACKWLKSKGEFTIGFDGATVRDFLEFINK